MTEGGAAVRAEIEALNVEFWYRVDHEGGEGVAELFCEEGVYSVPGGRNEGRSAIDESYALRRARGPRLSRHVHSNLRLTLLSPTEAHGVSMLTLWARDGEAPMSIVMPVSVSDVRDEYRKDGDGVWRIWHRHIAPAFRGEEPPVLPFTPVPDHETREG